ncbi:hypothetical protein B841_05420 [Corynebacterium maris DSM 45190]|uniref:Uncharacterized protein n=1 Tax=Corynebacterium maris DSM 45190 TaxID=1224163 RepID=S5SU42_9CORY|nr:hypothetical protein B841_05420 [Corynebacterium maris DSM 45190]
MSLIPLTPARRAFAIIGGLIVAATWFYLVLVRPTDWSAVGGSTEALLTLAGYVGGAALLLIAVLPALPARTIGLIPIALVLNIVIGQIIGAIGIPLYLDSVGTVLIAALAGPIAGLATGTLSSVVWGLFNPAALPFAAVAAATGWLAGLMIKHGGFTTLLRVILSGMVLGLVTGALSAPVAAFVYGGTAGGGNGCAGVAAAGDGQLTTRLRHAAGVHLRPAGQGHRPAAGVGRREIPAEKDPGQPATRGKPPPCPRLTLCLGWSGRSR